MYVALSDFAELSQKWMQDDSRVTCTSTNCYVEDVKCKDVKVQPLWIMFSSTKAMEIPGQSYLKDDGAGNCLYVIEG